MQAQLFGYDSDDDDAEFIRPRPTDKTRLEEVVFSSKREKDKLEEQERFAARAAHWAASAVTLHGPRSPFPHGTRGATGVSHARSVLGILRKPAGGSAATAILLVRVRMTRKRDGNIVLIIVVRRFYLQP